MMNGEFSLWSFSQIPLAITYKEKFVNNSKEQSEKKKLLESFSFKFSLHHLNENIQTGPLYLLGDITNLEQFYSNYRSVPRFLVS